MNKFNLYALIAGCIFLCLCGMSSVAAQDAALERLSLSKAIATALKNNPSIDAMTAAVAKSEYAHRAASKEWLPVLSASFLASTFNEAPQFEMGGISFPITTKDFFMLGAHVKMPLYTGGALQCREAMEKLGVNVSKMRLLEAKADLVQEVTLTFFMILRQEDYLKAIEENMLSLQEHEKVTQRFFDSDLVAKNILLAVQAKAASAKQEYVEVEKQLKLAKAALNVCMGIDIDTQFSLEGTAYRRDFTLSEKECFGWAEKNDPSLVVYTYLQQIAEQAIKLSNAGMLPKISADVSYYKHGNTMALDDHDYLSNNILLGMVTVDWTLFDWFKTGDLTASRKKELTMVMDQHKALSQQIRMDVKQCFLELEAALEKIAAAERGREYADENYRVSKLRYEARVARSTEVNDALSQLELARFNYYNACYEYNTAAAKLERIIGRKLG